MTHFLELSLIKGIIGLHQQVKQQLMILNQLFAYVSISIAAIFESLSEPTPLFRGTKSLLNKSILQDRWDRVAVTGRQWINQSKTEQLERANDQDWYHPAHVHEAQQVGVSATCADVCVHEGKKPTWLNLGCVPVLSGINTGENPAGLLLLRIDADGFTSPPW